MANNWGPVIEYIGSKNTFDRFRIVSPWGDVGAVLGGGFGTITSAAMVAHPTGLSVFFIAESNGSYHLWHTVRFSASGAWRPAQDVFSLTGAPTSATVSPWQISAGSCPEPGVALWTSKSTETLVALWNGPDPRQVMTIRVVRESRQWNATVTGIYSPMQSIPAGALTNSFTLRSIVVAARPFSDDATPSP